MRAVSRMANDNGHADTVMDAVAQMWAKRNEDIALMLEAGKTLSECGSKYGISCQRVKQIARSNGLKFGRKIRQSVAEKLIAPYLGGPLTAKQIADETGCVVSTVFAVARRRGVDFKKVVTRNTLHAACLLLTTKDSYKEISEASGVKRSVIATLAMNIRNLGFQPLRYGK